MDKPCYNQKELSLKKGYLKKPEANICGKCLSGLGTGFTKRILCYGLVILETAMAPFYIYIFKTNQSCFTTFAHKKSVMKSLTTGKQNT